MVVVMVAEKYPVESGFPKGQSLQFKGVLCFRTVQRRQIGSRVKKQAGVRGTDFNQIPTDLLCAPMYGYIHFFASSAFSKISRWAASTSISRTLVVAAKSRSRASRSSAPSMRNRLTALPPSFIA